MKSALLTLAAPLAIAGCDGHNPPGYNSQKPEDRQAITSLMTDFACRCAQLGSGGDFSDIKVRAEALAPQIGSHFEENLGPTYTLSAVGTRDAFLWSHIDYSMTCGSDNTLKAKDPCTYYTANISDAVSDTLCVKLSDIPWTTKHDGMCDIPTP